MAGLRKTSPRRKRTVQGITVAVVCLVLVVALCFAVQHAISGNLKAQGVRSIRSTVLHAAEQCYAVEGAYPPSLDYLKDNYGVQINEKNYVVTYVVFAANIQPTVTVVEK